MNGERFTLDTNILIYVVDSAAGWKQDAAIEVLQRATRKDCRLTLQSLSEFYSAATRKKIMGQEDAANQVDDWLTLFPSMALTPRAVRAAIHHAGAGRASYWDALLVETAVDGGCSVILSEDMGSGTRLGGAMIYSPFGQHAVSDNAEQVLG